MTKRDEGAVRWTPAEHESVFAALGMLSARQGHGFAAERANHLKDVVSGKTARLVGGNNAKNGPDRLVDGVAIQTKYHRTGAGCVAGCFEDGRYRYVNADGSPMALEVPRDGYEGAVGAMERRVAAGKVPGVDDPAVARQLVRRGFVTYGQAVNITKFGTVESLAYDAVNGAKVGAVALGVSTVVSFTRTVWQGQDADEALEAACAAGLRRGGVAWGASVLASQVGRTGVGASFGGTTRAAVGAAIVLSAPHLVRLFRREASGAQVFKDVVTTVAGVGGSVTGWHVGTRLGASLGPVGAFVGGVIGALVAGNLAAAAASEFLGMYIEDDAEEMMAVAEAVFTRLAVEHCLAEEEAVRVAREFVSVELGDTLREMYAAADREAFVENRVLPLVEKQVKRREGRSPATALLPIAE